MVYAARTDVPIAKSQQQCIDLLKKHGATQTAIGWSDDYGQVGFQLHDRVYKMTVPMRSKGTKVQQEQMERARWRLLHLVVKAKLEAVDAGISTVEQEFFASTVMPDGRTVFDHTQVAITAAYESGQIGDLLQLGS